MKKPLALTLLVATYAGCLVYVLGVRLVRLREMMIAAGEPSSSALFIASKWTEDNLPLAFLGVALVTAVFGWYASNHLRALDRRRTYWWFGGVTAAYLCALGVIAVAVYLPIFRMATEMQQR